MHGEFAFAFFPKDIDNEIIDFEPRYRRETTIHVASDGRITEVTEKQVPIANRMAPFVQPMRQQGKTVAGIDFSRAEDIVIIELDRLGGSVDGFLDSSCLFKPKPKAMSKKTKRPPSYLAHDPTKKHKRPRR